MGSGVREYEGKMQMGNGRLVKASISLRKTEERLIPNIKVSVNESI